MQIEAQVKEMQKLHIESKWRNREFGCELEQVMADCKQFKDPLEEAEAEKKAILLKKYQLLQLRILELEEENDSPRAQKERMSKVIHEGKMIFLRQKDMGCNFLLDHVQSLVVHKRNLASI